jgi:hypothetical protein
MMDAFGIDEKVLYKTWVLFLRRLSVRESAPDILRNLRQSGGINIAALDYFCFLGLNMFSDIVEDHMGKEDRDDVVV